MLFSCAQEITIPMQRGHLINSDNAILFQTVEEIMNYLKSVSVPRMKCWLSIMNTYLNIIDSPPVCESTVPEAGSGVIDDESGSVVASNSNASAICRKRSYREGLGELVECSTGALSSNPNSTNPITDSTSMTLTANDATAAKVAAVKSKCAWIEQYLAKLCQLVERTGEILTSRQDSS